MLAPMSDDAKKEIRQFCVSVLLACVPAFASWGVEALREKLKKKPNGGEP